MDGESFHRYCRLILKDTANTRWEAFSGKLSSKLAIIYNKLHVPYINIVTYYSSINKSTTDVATSKNTNYHSIVYSSLVSK